MDMRFGTWNVRSLYKAGSLKIPASELVKYNMDLVAVQKVRWVEGGSQPASSLLYTANHNLVTGFFVHKGIMSSEESRIYVLLF
jgi:hypothetical protein